jgi:DNA-binding IclR family transcriptional regulator
VVSRAQKTPTVPALDKALNILEALAESKLGLSLPEVVQRTGSAKSSVHCLLITLERRGYIHRNARTGRYMFGTRLFSLANTSIMGLTLREQAAPRLWGLAERTHLTVHMAILERGEAVLVAKYEPIGALRLATWIGKRMEVHCTGLGKAMLAYLPEDKVLRIIKEHGMPRHNENTICSPKRLLEDLELSAQRGYALDDEEDEIGLRCVGVPIRQPEGEVVAAISVAGTTTQIPRENIVPLSRELTETASKIVAAMTAQAHAAAS